MTLGTWTTRSSKYQKILNVLNTFMIIVSLILIGTAAVLIRFYHFTKLYFWDDYFYIGPVCMMVLGIFTLLAAAYGFVTSNYESRGLISVFAVFFSLSFLLQIVSIYIALETRNKILIVKTGASYSTNAIANMREYPFDESIRYNWDTLQSDLRCCGSHTFTRGFHDWSSVNLDGKESNKDVPQSCCQEPGINECGKNVMDSDRALRDLRIWVVGCMEIIELKLLHEAAPLLYVYSGVGVILALMKIITVAIACSYIAQITRRIKKAEKVVMVNGGEEDQYLQPSDGKETFF